MKKLLTKYWGVLLIVSLLSTLFVGTTVPAANAGTLAFTVQGTPLGAGFTNQVLANAGVTNLTVGPDGTLFAVIGNTVYKSTTNGFSWTPSVPVLDAALAAAVIVDLKVSPSYATDHTVFLLANQNTNIGPAQVYISVNSGLSFSVLGGTLAAGGAKIGTSLAIAPNYSSGAGEVMAATMDNTAAYGNVYIWGKNGVLNWVAQDVVAGQSDYALVAYSPAYSLDATRIAVSANATGTTINTLVASDATWNMSLGGLNTVIDATITGNNAGAGLLKATIAFPSDFNAMSIFTRTCYVGLSSGAGGTDTAWRVGIGGGLTAALQTSCIGFGFKSTSLAYSGTTASGTLYLGATGNATTAATVLYNTAPMAAAATAQISWLPPTTAPTAGFTGAAYLALANDFATSRTIYVRDRKSVV